MRRVICALVGHRFDEPKTIMGFSVRQCGRCGKAESAG
jgi:hypothetical protein